MIAKNLFAGLIVLTLLASCTKVLDEKSAQYLVVPTTIDNFQGVFDAPQITNRGLGDGEASTDNYWVKDADFDAANLEDRRLYTWEKDHVIRPTTNSWGLAYGVIYLCNTVIEGLNKIEVTVANVNAWNNVQGQAFFYRARMFYMLSTIYALQYDETTASGLPGIPLRLNTNFEETSARSTLQESYSRVLDDAHEAVRLLPVHSLHPTRASKPAAFALLARIYLTMKRYAEAALYADSSLQLHNALLDFNELNPASTAPLPRYNKEVVYHCYPINRPLMNASRAKVDSTLYRSFEVNDLRRTIYFRSNGDGTYRFKGSPESNSQTFDGFASNECYLIRAECRARAGDIAGAMEDLNTVMVMRWKAGTFVPFTAASASEALEIILAERRKELINRTLRWTDIKRLNSEGAAIELRRVVHGVEYVLPPNDLRYALPIPEEIIRLTGMQQNAR